jgi:hypothetical protein
VNTERELASLVRWGIRCGGCGLRLANFPDNIAPNCPPRSEDDLTRCEICVAFESHADDIQFAAQWILSGEAGMREHLKYRAAALWFDHAAQIPLTGHSSAECATFRRGAEAVLVVVMRQYDHTLIALGNPLTRRITARAMVAIARKVWKLVVSEECEIERLAELDGWRHAAWTSIEIRRNLEAKPPLNERNPKRFSAWRGAWAQQSRKFLAPYVAEWSQARGWAMP